MVGDCGNACGYCCGVEGMGAEVWWCGGDCSVDGGNGVVVFGGEVVDMVVMVMVKLLVLW